jgi:hypothetical protein
MPIDNRIVESRIPILWRMSAGTLECVMLAGRLASDSVPPRPHRKLEYLQRPWPPTMSNENVEPAPRQGAPVGNRRSRRHDGRRKDLNRQDMENASR